MKLIIDGYNLIKKVMKMQHISSDSRDQFLKRLGIYAKTKGLQILIVFDGGEASFNYRERAYGIEALYSGFLESADDVINRYISEHRSQEDLLVVSSDREITDFAASRDIDILKSEEFYDLLRASEFESKIPRSSSSINKITTSSSPEVDELMEIASRGIKLKQESPMLPRLASSQKLSKDERQKQRKLKKL